MKRFFIVSVLIAGAMSLGWRYAPGGMREKLLGFADLANVNSVSGILRNVVRPEDPVIRRQAAIEALKEKMGAIQERLETIGNAGTSDAATAFLGDIKKAADEATEIIIQLEEANDEQSLGGRVAARVVDAVLPSPPSPQCVEQ